MGYPNNIQNFLQRKKACYPKSHDLSETETETISK